SDAASATACAWFPDEKAATPRDRSASASDEILLYAPRNLNAPPRWRFSALRYTRAPARESSVREVTTGVRWATPSSRRAAASTSPGEIGGTQEGYCAWTSQPRYISASTASVTNAVAWWASANVYGPGRSAVAVGAPSG